MFDLSVPMDVFTFHTVHMKLKVYLDPEVPSCSVSREQQTRFGQRPIVTVCFYNFAGTISKQTYLGRIFLLAKNYEN